MLFLNWLYLLHISIPLHSFSSFPYPSIHQSYPLTFFVDTFLQPKSKPAYPTIFPPILSDFQPTIWNALIDLMELHALNEETIFNLRCVSQIYKY